MNRFLPREFARLAKEIEQKFFHIERESRWLAGLINGVIAGGSVGLIAWLVTSFEQDNLKFETGDLLLFACLGSSSAAVVMAPTARHNSLRSIIMSYLVASAVCILLFHARRFALLPLPIKCFFAVAASILLMRLLDAMHPSAVGSAMAFIIYEREVISLFLLMPAILALLTLVKVLAYVYREELTFRDFHREFRRDYYGTEMTITVPQEQSAVES